MGRSKFPGKPSKHVNRKRINVLPATSEIIECGGALTVETVVENKQTDGEEKSVEVILNATINKNVSLRRRLTRKMQNGKALLNTSSSKRGLISKLCNKSSVKIKTKLTRKHGYSTLKNFKQCRSGIAKESNNLVGKFVLPTRSVHSSRVIKPNKRFINVDLSDTLTLKKRVITKRLKQSESVKSDVVKESPTKSFSNGRIVLRQARLKLHNQSPKGSEGPFSSTSANGSPPGTVTCGVCGAVRFYRFVKQARKFNIYSCESCRKFISKMIKRQSCGKNSTTLVCHKGQGMCHVPPIVRSQQMKLIRCAYRSRCPACWLKMCLRSFQMPLSLKNSLIQLLPKNMQGSDVMFNNLLWQVTVPNIEQIKQPEQGDTIKRPVRYKNNPKPVAPITDIKRQKVDLKGPRVKHVCRSASIVLGQPLATFPSEKKENTEKKTKSDEKCSKDEHSENDTCDDKLNRVPLVLNEAFVNLKRDRTPRVPSTVSSYSSILSSSFITTRASFENKTDLDKRPNAQDLQNMVVLDYWDNSDFDDIYQNGFCLLASQQFPMPAICFLCGSAGREALMHCSLCAEPYHSYCLERVPVINNKDDLWFCNRCTTCNSCNQTGREKLNCQKCSKAYHSDCLRSGRKATICFKCVSCKDCGDTTSTKFFANVPLCVTCFKSRIKGSCCPICLIPFIEGGEKTMECTKCKKWVHSDCDELSEEYYYILSYLPESVKYLCGLCSKQSPPLWCKAVQSELKCFLNQVLRRLTQHKLSLLRKDVISEDNQDVSYSEFKTNETKGVTVLEIKRKLNLNEYYSVRDFNTEMEEALSHAQSVLALYKTIFKSVFPWFKASQVDDVLSTSNFKRLLNSTNGDDYIVDQLECTSIDSRYCSFCKSIGDGLSHLESRLLYCGRNEWVHINCAFWSSEVFEEIDGSLQNVQIALTRGRSMRCSYCKQKGATVGCCFKDCSENYHFVCARTANCQFFNDKTVYCSSHELTKKGVITKPNDFNIRRSVFVEVRNQKKEYAHSDKVNVMVGSLSVNSLGKIITPMSDTPDALIPTGYSCSRLFWSTSEPWKLVSYKITTSLLNAHVNNLHIDKSFTVDHSLPKSIVERKLKEILHWQKDIDKKKSEPIDFDDEEEPQNGADLLSPEITDAIFKELPHELLDGISVQDIFPKLMAYEDFINQENDDSKPDLDGNDDLDFKTKSQRSCNLTLSCKLDNSFSPVMKKRKMAPRDNLFFQILQVDGAFDDSSSDDGISGNIWNDGEEPVTCERCQCTYRTQASYRRHLDSCEVICTSESDSELIQETENIEVPPQIHIPDNDITQQPLVIASYESYQNEIHTSVLNTQTYVASKEVISVPQTSEILIPQTISEPVVNNEVYTVPVNESQFCVNSVPLLTLQPNPVNQTLVSDFQPFMNMTSLNNSTVINVPNGRWIKQDSPKSPLRTIKARGRSIAAKRTIMEEEIVVQSTNPMIVQQIPQTNYIPTYVDTFQQSNQNVQYVTTIAPVQFQTDNSMISLLPGIQPMIIQQPQVLENQLIVDNGLRWTQPQVQPVYYGFETIVQNTVMQSQQFLPSTVPGVLTANSSYSTTTQVFQTSKLEPVLDMSTNSFVLLNTGQLVNSQSLEVPQPNILPTPEPCKYSPTPQTFQKPNPTITPINTNSITLPTAPFVPEQGIPTNIVTPIPKSITTQSRPMSRVLPMQNIIKEPKVKFEAKIVEKLPPVVEFEKKPPPPPPKIVVEPCIPLDTNLTKPIEKELPVIKIDEVSNKNSTKASDGYKVSRNSPVQIAPLKPIKSNPPPQILSDKQNRQDNVEKKIALEPPPKPLPMPEKKETENIPSIVYTIETQDGFKYSSTSIADLWAKVLEAVQTARAAHNMPLLPVESSIKNLEVLGLKTTGLRYLLEQLPGTTKCTKYKPSFDFPSKFIEIEDDLIGHHSGCSRAGPHVKRNERYDMFDWLASKHRKPENRTAYLDLNTRRGSVNNLPLAMRFRHLKLTSKFSVGVYRSRIHRRGLFCLRDFEAGEMVIEYSGEVIRSILTDKREKYYNSKGIGCYMFRIDDNLVVDATMTGNAARFINHSCDPNCYSKVVEILGHKHIIIFALRKIVRGEELTYDYKFPIEEDKIPCTCGARRCRKFLN